jgi:PAS domain S-box-containing protein
VAGEKILIVDPNVELQQNVVEQILIPHSYKPLQAYSQNEGVKLAIAKSPDLLLLHLPLDSVVQLLQRLAQTGHLLPSILMIEQASPCVPVEFLQLSVQDYVIQPFTTEDMLQAIQRVLAQEMRVLNYQQLAQDLNEFNQVLEQRVKKFGAILGSGGSANSMEDLDSVLNRVTEAAMSVTKADTGYLFLIDEKTDELRLRAAQNLSKTQAEVFRTQNEDSISRSVLRSGKPILLSGSNGQYIEFKSGYPIKSLLNVPLKVDERVIGVLGVDNQTSNARFSLVDLRYLTELAEMAGTAVVNARQYAEARQEIARHIEEVATLQAVTSELSYVTDFNMGAQLALSLALKATNAEVGVLAWAPEEEQSPIRYVTQGNPGEMASVQGSRPPKNHWWDEQALREVIQSGQPTFIFDLGRPANDKRNGKGRLQARSRLTVPMRRGGKVMGAINLESSLPNAFTQEDIQFVTSIADQVVITLEGAFLQEKAESERDRLSLLMSAVDNGVWLVDADLRLMAQNEAASQMLDWSEAEVVGRRICDFEISNGEAAHGLCQLLSQAIEKQHQISFNEGVLLTKRNGSSILVKVKIAPVVREEGVMGAICAFHPSKKADEQVRFEFANMAAHLLRTPLASIQASVDLLLNSELSVEEQRAMLDQMREQSQRMREFVRELLEMSRLEAGIVRVYAEPVALSPLIDRVLGLIRQEEPRHSFSLSVGGALPIVTADLAKTELILVNLLRSAVSRCLNNGHIALEVETHHEEVVVSIADDGEAIPIAQLDRIFSQFYPIDSTIGSMMSSYHLGLYTTRRLIELQNGRVWVESQPGKGSRFSFSLPVWR